MERYTCLLNNNRRMVKKSEHFRVADGFAARIRCCLSNMSIDSSRQISQQIHYISL